MGQRALCFMPWTNAPGRRTSVGQTSPPNELFRGDRSALTTSQPRMEKLKAGLGSNKSQDGAATLSGQLFRPPSGSPDRPRPLVSAWNKGRHEAI